MARLIDALTPAGAGPDRFSAPGGRGGWISLYGGQLVAQALAAATRTVGEDRLLHSLHATFLREGAFDVPLDLGVERERDGRSFSARRVTIRQSAKPVLSLSASFHVEEDGPTRDTLIMPDVPAPDGLPPVQDLGPFRKGHTPFAWLDLRAIDGCQPFPSVPGPPTGTMWMRVRDAEGASAAQQRILLAYLSDLLLINTAVRPHVGEVDAASLLASLDHALWVHDDCDAGDWLLYVQDSPWAGKGRVMCRGAIFARDGRHIATIAQEALVRLSATV